jgi:hypothetical protein
VRHARTFLLAAAALCCGRPLAAQTVDGVLLEESTRAPVSRAMVSLLDSAGKPVATTQTRPDGKFTLRAQEQGTYRVRAERVGRVATVSTPIELGLGETKPFELLAKGEVVQLEGIVAQAGERACSVRPDAEARVATVWEEARKALTAAEWTRRYEPRVFTVRTYSREMDAASLTVKREQARTARMQQVTPFRSLPADRLAEQGYVQRDGREMVYYAPDAEVLLSEPFLDGHCFRLHRDAEKPGLLGLAFEPVRGRRLPDIQGVLWLDEKTAELKSLDFEYTRVQVPQQDVDRTRWGARGEVVRHAWGGRLEFDRQPDGVWFVRRFHIRMPVMGTAAPDAQNLRSQSAVGLVAVKEDGAEVTGLRTASQVVIAEQPAGGAAVSGVVYDSTRARGLAEATVFLVGTEHIAVTDSAGAFRLENVPDGRYAVSFSHPRADSLILVPTPVEVELKRGRVETVALSMGRPRQQVAAASAASDSAIRLRPLVATAAATQRRLNNAGFYDRQRVGTGAFLTGEQFKRRPGARVLDMLQGLRGIYARPTPQQRWGEGDWTFYQYRFGRRCVALLWVDGMQRPVKELERIDPDDVEAVEVYSGDEVPMRFAVANSEMGGQSMTDPERRNREDPAAGLQDVAVPNAVRNAGNGTVCGAVVVWLKTPIP